MTTGFKVRLTSLIMAIALMATLILWTAVSSWRGIDNLREELTDAQWESFNIAEHFQKILLSLNNTLLRFGIQREEADWESFLRDSDDLNHWIDEQVPKLNSAREKQILHEIDRAYDEYLAAASQIRTNQPPSPRASSLLVEFASFEGKSEVLLKLGYQLADAHRKSLNAFLTESNLSLSHLQIRLLGALVLLLIFGGSLAIVTYREMIAPLRVRLVESDALIERQEKLASLGMLAAGVAHEIRNPLTAIKARLFTQQKQLNVGSPAHEDAVVIGGEINRLERIVKDFLTFARPKDPDLAVIPAASSLQEVQALLGPQLEKLGIRLVLDPSPEARIRVDPPQMKQVLINLVQNAADSVDRDGVIHMRVRLGSATLAGHLTEIAILEVEDSGSGISPEVEKRLFDPFFTTKESGTGLGLSIAARIVERHGGALQYQTQMNRGTIFGVVLPRVH